MTNVDYYVRTAQLFNPLREPIIRSVIQAVQFAPGSRGLDAGCGIGLQSLLLAEAVGPAGLATGLDLDPRLLAHAEASARAASLSCR